MDPSADPSAQIQTSLDLAQIFTFLFLMLGPLKILGPFAMATRELSEPERRKLAFNATIVSTIAVIAGGFVGQFLLAKWNVSIPALMLGAGLVFLLVALRLVLHQYEPAAPPAANPGPKTTAMKFAFPSIVTPYGIAAVIIFMTISAGGNSGISIGVLIGLIITVMLLDLLAMLFSRQILGALGLPLQVLGVVLGVIQVALAVQIILNSLRHAGIIAPLSS